MYNSPQVSACNLLWDSKAHTHPRWWFLLTIQITVLQRRNYLSQVYQTNYFKQWGHFIALGRTIVYWKDKKKKEKKTEIKRKRPFWVLAKVKEKRKFFAFYWCSDVARQEADRKCEQRGRRLIRNNVVNTICVSLPKHHDAPNCISIITWFNLMMANTHTSQNAKLSTAVGNQFILR